MEKTKQRRSTEVLGSGAAILKCVVRGGSDEEMAFEQT